jgi:hypothetical protein
MLEICPYKNNISSQIKKFHVTKNDEILKFKICNLSSPFGRKTDSDHNTSYSLHQHRLNIEFNHEDLKNNKKSYEELTKIIRDIEQYFKEFDELKNMELVSNIINRDGYGIVIRFHLKTFKNKTTTPLTHCVNGETSDVEWVQFNKNNKFNIDFHPDCLWIDENNKKFGISFVIDRVFQMIL